MKQIPILFSTPMVRAILEGRKTQTRRIVKSQPVIDSDSGYVYSDRYIYSSDIHNWKSDWFHKYCKYKVGDILWVRETFHKHQSNEHGVIYSYKADNKLIEHAKIWKPSLFMPREACRIFLKIVSVRIERLNDITILDAMAESCSGNEAHTAKDSFSMLWESINGSGSWDQNPWVWVIEFERTETPACKHEWGFKVLEGSGTVGYCKVCGVEE